MRGYRAWFLAAAMYNALWGVLVSLWPNCYFDWLHLPIPNYPSLFQCIGMMVGVYSIAYWLISRDPIRYGALVWVGLLGKLLGPIGFAVTAMRGGLPWSFGWINLTNDVIWLPAFIAFAFKMRGLEFKQGQS